MKGILRTFTNLMSISEGDPQNFYQFEGLAASNHYRGRNLTCCLKLRASN